MRQVLLFAAVFAFLASPARAQQSVKLEIKDGKVTLEANNAPARQILSEWSKIGGTKVVGSEKVTGALLTLKLVNVPERQALDIILRNAAGYIAAPRLASAAAGASGYDRILILPTSTATPASSAAASVVAPGRAMMPGGITGTERRVMPRPPGVRPGEADADEPVQSEPEPDVTDNGIPNTGQPVFTFPQPQMPGNQVFMPVQNGAPGTVPQINLQPNPNGQPTIYNFVPQGGAAAPVNGGFNVIGSPTPGVIQQPVTQPGQTTPPTPQRPPGGR